MEQMEQWRELSLVSLRTLSCLARACIDARSPIVQQILDSEEPSLLDWFQREFLPLRLLSRCEGKKSGENEHW
jgi:hypothetical protein